MSVSGDDMDVEGSGEGVPLCMLCQKGGILCSRWGGMWFHKRCSLAVRSRVRQMKTAAGSSSTAQKEAISKEKTLMRDKPLVWRSRVMPFMSEDKDERKAARAATRSEVTSFRQTVSVNGEFQLEDDLLLTKKAYRDHRFEESCSSRRLRPFVHMMVLTAWQCNHIWSRF